MRGAQDGAELLGEAMVGGRPVSVFRLREPLDVGTHRIRLLELPAPKEGSAYATGWEHVEVALGSDEKLEALAAQLRETSSLKVNWRNWTRASNREVRVTPPGLPTSASPSTRGRSTRCLPMNGKTGLLWRCPTTTGTRSSGTRSWARAEEAAALARYENLLREAQFVPAGDGSLERLLASGPELARLEGATTPPARSTPRRRAAGALSREEFDARLEHFVVARLRRR